MDSTSKLLVVVEVGSRTLAMAQRVVHQVTQVLAPGCVPLFLTDGLKDYGTALLTHFGHWIQPKRRQDRGPRPKPRWMPLPALLYVQPEVISGQSAVKVWRPCTPAMAAGLTDHVWSLKDVLLYRVPPWPQAQTV